MKKYLVLLMAITINCADQKDSPKTPKVINNTENITVNIETHQTGTIEQKEELEKSCCRTPTKIKCILMALGGTTIISLSGVLALFVKLSECKQ